MKRKKINRILMHSAGVPDMVFATGAACIIPESSHSNMIHYITSAGLGALITDEGIHAKEEQPKDNDNNSQ